MATSGTILSLPTRRPLRKPSDGGGGTSEQRVRRENDAQLGQSRAAFADHVIAVARPLAARVHEPILHPPVPLCPSLTLFLFLSTCLSIYLSLAIPRPISHRARDRIPRYRRSPLPRIWNFCERRDASYCAI